VNLSIVMPAYNEAENLPGMLAALDDFIASADCEVEVIVVDDGSVDNSGRILSVEAQRRPWLKTITMPRNMGMGAALRRGTASATQPLVAWVMADRSDRLDDLCEMRRRLLAGADLVVGSRAAPGGGYGDFVGAKAWGSWLFSQFARRLLGLPISDSTNAFRAFRREVFAELHLLRDDFAISIEMVAQAAAHGRRIEQTPTIYAARRQGVTHFRIVRMGAIYLFLTLRAWISRLYRRDHGATGGP